MFEGARVAVVVPAYNEADRIEDTLRTVPEWVDHVIVVDDGSTDGTATRAGRVTSSAMILRHSKNRGAGAAIASGYDIAFAAGADVAAVMAGDGQMDPTDLQQVVGPVARGRTDYCKGNRLAHPDATRAMPVVRFIGNHILSRLTSVALGKRVRDSQCGFTALGRNAAATLPLLRLWPGYGYPNDLLGLVRLTGLRFEEVVVRPVYDGAKSGVGVHHAVLVVPFLLLRLWLRRALRPLTGRSARRSPSGTLPSGQRPPRSRLSRGSASS